MVLLEKIKIICSHCDIIPVCFYMNILCVCVSVSVYLTEIICYYFE